MAWYKNDRENGTANDIAKRTTENATKKENRKRKKKELSERLL